MAQPQQLIYLDLQPKDRDARPAKLLRADRGPVEYALVGIAPSMNRPLARDNEPFGASSWSMLSRVIKVLAENLYLTNLIKTPQPATKKPPKRLVNAAYPILVHELQLVQPKKILALGSAVAEVLCPGFTSLREDHGTLFYNPELGAMVVPTYHFAAVGRDPSKMPFFARDLTRFIEMTRPTPPHFRTAVDIPPFTRNGRVFLDIETTGLDPMQGDILSIGLADAGDPTRPWIFSHPTAKDLRRLLFRIREAGATLVGHNFSFDLDWLTVKSEVKFWDVKVEDTMIMGHNLGEEVLALKHLTTMYTDRPGSRAFGGPEDLGYLAEDVLSTAEVYDCFVKRGAKEMFVTSLMNRAVPHIVRMRKRGVYIDRPRMESLVPGYTEKIAALEVALNAVIGHEVKWTSSAQVVEALQSTGMILTEKTDAGAFSVKESVLLGLASVYPIAKQLLELRDVIKEREFFISYLERTTADHPYLHPKIFLTGTRTGRLSCKDPNVQQVKRTGPIKSLFVPRWPGGKIGLIDLSQAELRVACLLSDDVDFRDALLSEDVHRTIASWIFHKEREDISAAERKKSKGITFGLLYGGSSGGLAARVGTTVADVDNIVASFFDRFKKLARFIKRTQEQALQTGYVKTVFGNVRDLRSLLELEGENSAKRKAINTPIQGVASHIALMILTYCAETLYNERMNSDIMFGVHDSVLLEIYPGELDRVIQIVQAAYANLKNSPLADLKLWSTLPMVGELVIGDSWAAVESTNEGYKPDSKHPCSSHSELSTGGIISERAADAADESDDEEQAENEPVADPGW